MQLNDISQLILYQSYNFMLSSLVKRRFASFSKLFYQPSVLDYPIIRNE